METPRLRTAVRLNALIQATSLGQQANTIAMKDELSAALRDLLEM